MAWWVEVGGVEAVTMTISVLGDPTSSQVTIAREDPSSGTLDTWDLEYKESTASEWTTITGLTAATHDVSGLEPETAYDFRATGHVLVDSVLSTTTATTEASTAPTVPSARAIVGRAQSLDYLFGGAGNTAGWWGYAGLEPAVVGPTPITFTVRVKNKTNMTWDTVTFPVLAGHASNASIIGAWIGVGGTNQTPGSGGWQQILFDGVGTKALPSGTQVVPYVTAPDLVTLGVPCAPNDSVVIRIAFAASGEISVFDALSDTRTPESDLASCWMARGDYASTSGARDTAAAWEFWGDSPMHALFVEGASGSPMAVSEMVVGDSVIQAFRAWQNVPEAGSRDGWIWQYEQINDKAVRLSCAGNGAFSLVQYCQRLEAILPVYAPWLDVVVLEGWTPNFAPTSAEGNAPLKAALESAITAIEAAGRGFAFIFPSPACLSHTPPGADVSLADMIAYCKARNPALTMDMSLTLADPLDPDNYDEAYSPDALHHNLAGNTAFAAAWKPVNEAMLTTGIGYEI